MRVIIIGASGATGKELLDQLLSNERITEVSAWGTKKLPVTHSKLKSEVVNFEKLEEYATNINADIAFSCIGTTLKKAGTKKAQWKIDYEYQLKFATICAQSKVSKFVLISSLGAHPNSRIFYSKMKGQLDEAVKKLHFETLLIFRPSSLIRPGTDRAGEKVSLAILKFINKIGLLKYYQPIETKVLASKMLLAACESKQGIFIYEGSGIFTLEKNE